MDTPNELNVTIKSTPKVDFSKPLDTSSVKGKSVLITGGAAGLGWAIASSLANVGANITIADVNAEAGEAAAKELVGRGAKAISIKTDVSDWDSQLAAFKAAITHFGTIDIVIPNAGVASISMHDMVFPKDLPPDADLPKPATHCFDVNLTGVYYTTTLALHYFAKLSAKESTGYKKQLLFMASLAGYVDVPLFSGYSASKWGVRGLYKTLRSSGDSFGGVRMNLIAPTYIETSMSQSFINYLKSAGIYVGVPEDVAQACMRCCCDESVNRRSLLVCSGIDVGDGKPGSAIFDICDDAEGYDGGREVNRHLVDGTLVSAQETLVKQFGLNVEEDTKS